MMKKFIFLPLSIVALASCSVPFKTDGFRAPEPPSLQNMLLSKVEGGYVKKTTISNYVCLHSDYFHCKIATPRRATYYNADETALLMGEFDGTFEEINSGYRNNDTGIQHFTYRKSGDYFTNIDDDWTYEGQFVGDYYPTLTSLSSLIEDTDWNYNVDHYEYIGNDEKVIGKFQYFAAPLLLLGKINLEGIKVKYQDNDLVIQLFDSTETLVSYAHINNEVE